MTIDTRKLRKMLSDSDLSYESIVRMMDVSSLLDHIDELRADNRALYVALNSARTARDAFSDAATGAQSERDAVCRSRDELADFARAFVAWVQSGYKPDQKGGLWGMAVAALSGASDA